MTEPRDEARDVLAEALVALGPGTIDEMAWSHHKWVMGDLYYIVVEDERGSPVPDDYPMASLAGAILEALAARGYRLAAEPAPDVEDTGAVREAAIEAVLSEALPGNIYHRLRKALWPQHVTDDTFCLCDGCFEYMQEDAR